MVERERVGRTSYLTCNDRHHELILTQAPENRGCDHLALQVADAAALETARAGLPKAGGVPALRERPRPATSVAFSGRRPGAPPACWETLPLGKEHPQRLI